MKTDIIKRMDPQIMPIIKPVSSGGLEILIADGVELGDGDIISVRESIVKVDDIVYKSFDEDGDLFEGIIGSGDNTFGEGLI